MKMAEYAGKKHLVYNYKRVSSLILRAETSDRAELVVTQARTQAAQLRRKLKTGEYDGGELESAILHAERIVWIAKKKERNLEEEERVHQECGEVCATMEDGALRIHARYLKEPEVRNRQEYDQAVRKLQGIIKKLNDRMAEELNGGVDELLEQPYLDTVEDIEPSYLIAMKKKHRSDEFREVTEADLTYLKSRFAYPHGDGREAEIGVRERREAALAASLVTAREASAESDANGFDILA